MSDVVVTVPAPLWRLWLSEGDLARGGAPAAWEGENEYYYAVGRRPRIEPGERVYIVALGKLRGYAPLVRIDRREDGAVVLVRRGGAVAVTLADGIRGFQGWRYRWWDRGAELPFPNWTAD